MGCCLFDAFVVATIIVFVTPSDSTPVQRRSHDLGLVNLNKLRLHLCNVNYQVGRLKNKITEENGDFVFDPITSENMERVLSYTGDGRLPLYRQLSVYRQLFDKLKASIRRRSIARPLRRASQAVGELQSNMSGNCLAEIQRGDCSAMNPEEQDPVVNEIGSLNDDDAYSMASSLASRLLNRVESLLPNACSRSDGTSGKRKKMQGQGKKRKGRKGRNGRKGRHGAKGEGRRKRLNRKEKEETELKEPRDVGKTETVRNVNNGVSDQGLDVANAKVGQVNNSIEAQKGGNSSNKAQKRDRRRRRRKGKGQRQRKGRKTGTRKQRKHDRRNRGKSESRRRRKRVSQVNQASSPTL